MYLKIKNGIVDTYPYFIENIRAENPNTSFSATLSDEVLAEYGVFKVKEVEAPQIDYTKNIFELTPELINGEWTQVWEIKPASQEELLERVLAFRASEYPPMADYLDGIVKGNQAQIDKYVADCLAVKAKYPKP